MPENKKSYCIVKKMRILHPFGPTQHVILVDGHSEIQEWDSREDAQKIADLFNANTDSGHEYIVSEI